MLSEDRVERHALRTMYIAWCPEQGIIDTKPYEELARHNAIEYMRATGKHAYVIEASRIMRFAPDSTVKRVYRMEAEFIPIQTRLLKDDTRV